MNLKKFFTLVFLFLILIFRTSFSQLPPVMLTDSARVSLLTCSQGEELYSIFGHSAIRISDPILGLDWVFNYGTFDFSDPNFYPNFVKGKLNYILSVSNYKNFEYTYIVEKRFIYEQVLNLKSPEKQMLLDSLSQNYLPENRYYLYDFLFDNCATRIRDIFVERLPRTIDFPYSGMQSGLSFRDLLMPNVKEKPWAKLGINLLLGVSADRPADFWEYMFLPEHMMMAFKSAEFASDSTLLNVVQPPVTILTGSSIPVNRFKNSPIFVFILILLITVVVSYFDYRRMKISRGFDIVLFLFVGLLGFVIAFQWFGSDHAVMSNNYNLIWTHPLHLIAAIALMTNGLRKFLKYYFGINMIVLLLLLVFWFVLPQALPFPMFPLVAAMALRSAVLYKYK